MRREARQAEIDKQRADIRAMLDSPRAPFDPKRPRDWAAIGFYGGMVIFATIALGSLGTVERMNKLADWIEGKRS